MNIKNLHLATLISHRTVMLMEVYKNERGRWKHRFEPERPDIKVKFFKDGKDTCVAPTTPLTIGLISVKVEGIKCQRENFTFDGNNCLRLVLTKKVVRQSSTKLFLQSFWYYLNTPVPFAILASCLGYFVMRLWLSSTDAFRATELALLINFCTIKLVKRRKRKRK